MSATRMLLGCFFSLRVNVDCWNDTLVCCNWPVASNWYHLSSYRCNDLVINRQFITLTLTLCDEWRLPAREVKLDQGAVIHTRVQSWARNFLQITQWQRLSLCRSLLCVPLLCHLLSDLLWLDTLTEEHACVSCNSKSYWYDHKNNTVVFSPSESGRPFWSSRSSWQVGVDNQRCEACWLGSLWLWGTQQDRRSSEEHVSGHWVWVYYNPITV